MAYIKQLKIGAVAVRNNLVMAPMAGITDRPFRSLVRECGAGLVCTEMVSASAIVHGDKKTLHLMELGADEHPVSVQMFGSDPYTMAEAARTIEEHGADILDINMGCPVRKIVKTGAGAKLIENEALFVKIMESVVARVRIPVTIKIRIGVNPEENLAPVIIRRARESGISMVTVHGRAAVNGHKGKADLEALARAAEGSGIPVVANGGIVDEDSAKTVFDVTKCDGIMIGRGAIGDPAIFTRVGNFLSTGDRVKQPSWEDRLAVLERHAVMNAAYYGEKKGVILLRKIAPYYLKGLPNASRIRNRFNVLTTVAGIRELCATVWESPYFTEEVANE